MFPTDQQRRLQVASNVNPSIRSVAAPYFGIQGGTANIQGSSFNPQGNNYNPQNQGNANQATNVRLGPVQQAPAQNLSIQTQPNRPPVFIPRTVGLAGAPDFAPRGNLTDAIIGAGQGVAKSFTGVPSIIPTLIGQAKPLVPGAFDHYIDTARNKTQSLINAPFNAYTNIAQKKGYDSVTGQPITSQGRLGERVGSDVVNTGYALQAAADAPKIFASAKGAVKAAKGLFSNDELGVLKDAGINVAHNPDVQFAEHAAEDLPKEAGAAITVGDVAGQEKVDQELARQEANSQRQQQQNQPSEIPYKGQNAPTSKITKFTPEEQQLLEQTGVKPSTSQEAVAQTGAKTSVKTANPTFSSEEMAFMKKQNVSPEILQKAQVADHEGNVAPAVSPKQEVAQAVEAQAPKSTATPAEAPAVQQQVAKEAIAQQGLTKAELKAARNQNIPENLIAQDHQAKGGQVDANGVSIASDAPKPKTTTKTPVSTEPKPVAQVVPQSSTEGKLVSKTSLENRLKSLGQSGQEALQTVRNKEVAARVHTQELLDTAKPFYDLTPEEQAAAIKVHKGEATAPDERVQAGADALTNMFKETHAGATTVGLKVGNLGENYFPKSFPKGWFDKPENFNKAAQDMVASGKAKDLETAVSKLNKLKIEGKLNPREFGNFKSRETELPNGIENADTVTNYIKGAANRISEAEHFGPKGEILNGHVADAIKRGEDGGALKKILSSYTNPAQGGEGAVAKGLNAYQKTLRVLQLPRAAVSHLPQGFANTASDIGYTKYFKSMAKKVFKDPETENFLHEGGFRVDDIGKSGNLADKATAPGLKPMLQFHREVAAEGGRSLALGLAKHGDEEALGKIGVTGPFTKLEDGTIDLTKQQQIQAGHFEADKSIGSHSPIQSPAWTQSDSGKLIGMYRKMYTFKQAERIANLFKDAKAGNVAPLARYLAVGLPVSGLGITLAKDELSNPGSNPFSDPKKLALDSARHSGGLSVGYGAADSAVNAAAHNYGSDSRWANAASAISPGLGTAVQTFQNVNKAVRGKPRSLIREAAAFSPIGGKAIANKIAPAATFGTNGRPLPDGSTEVPLKDPSGTQLTGTKGQPATVTIPKGVTGAAKQALIDNARGNVIASNIKASLSPQERALYDQSDPKLKSMLDSKQIDQSTYDQIQAYKKVASNVTKAPAVLPKSLDSNVKDYLNQTSKLTDQGKLNWAKNAKGQALSQKVADELNGQLPDGIAKLSPSKDLLDAYAKFDKSRADAAANTDPNKQWDDIVSRGKLRDFWKNAIEVSQPKDVKEIYGLSSTQLKDYFIKGNKITPDQLKAAVALNDDLLAADLSDTNKYSKKFRETFGLPGIPDNGSASGTKGSFSSSTKGKTVGQFKGVGSTNAQGTRIITNADGTQSLVRVDPATGLDVGGSLGLSQLLPKTLSFSQPNISTVPEKKTFKINLPADVTGRPKPSRVVSLRAKRARIL
jgi:hypothetical protein